MPINKLKVHKRNYLTVDKTSADDEGLSLRAYALHMYLIGKPDTWKVRITHIANRFGCGHQMIREGLKELAAAGYLVNTQPRNSKGQVQGTVMDLYELPQGTNRDDTWPNVGESEGKEPTEMALDRMSVKPDVGEVPPIVSTDPVVSTETVASTERASAMREREAMFAKVADICGLDMKLKASRIGKTVKNLRAAGYTLEDLNLFGRFVWRFDWRWQKHQQRPTLPILEEEIGKLRALPLDIPNVEEKRVGFVHDNDRIADRIMENVREARANIEGNQGVQIDRANRTLDAVAEGIIQRVP